MTYYSQLARCHRDMGERNLANQLFMRALELRREHGDDAGSCRAMLDVAALRSRNDSRRRKRSDPAGCARPCAGSVGERHPLAIDLLRSLCTLGAATIPWPKPSATAGSPSCWPSNCGRSHRATIDAPPAITALYVDLRAVRRAESDSSTRTMDAGTPRPGNPDLARTYNSLAIVAWERGDLARAERHQRQAVPDLAQRGHNPGLLGSRPVQPRHGPARRRQGGRQTLAAVRVGDAASPAFRRSHELVGDADRHLTRSSRRSGAMRKPHMSKRSG